MKRKLTRRKYLYKWFLPLLRSLRDVMLCRFHILALTLTLNVFFFKFKFFFSLCVSPELERKERAGLIELATSEKRSHLPAEEKCKQTKKQGSAGMNERRHNSCSTRRVFFWIMRNASPVLFQAPTQRCQKHIFIWKSHTKFITIEMRFSFIMFSLMRALSKRGSRKFVGKVFR